MRRESRTALFIGGPWAGEIRIVTDPYMTIAYVKEPGWEYRFEGPADEPVPLEKGYYVPQVISFWNAPLRVWVHDVGMSDVEIGSQIGAALLNELGLTLLREENNR